MSWDDLRFFLAIARHRTLTDAARALTVSHTTVARRLEQLQLQAKTELLTKTPDGFVLTERGQALRQVAERLEAEAHAAERLLVDVGPVEGRLTVTTVDVVFELYWDVFSSFMRAHPEVELAVYLDNRNLDLTRRRADVAIRFSNAPSEVLVGRKLGRHLYAPYAAQSLIDRVNSEVYADYPWILWTEDLRARMTEAWFQRNVGGRPAARVNHTMAMGQMIRAGAGAALLTEIAGDHWGLAPIGPRLDGFELELWILTHPDLKHAERVRAFMDHFVAAVCPSDSTA